MNRLMVLEIKRRRYEERQQKALANAAGRSPIEHPITYILNKQNRLMQQDCRQHRNAEGNHKSMADRVSLTLLPTGYKASKLIRTDAVPLNEATELPNRKFTILQHLPPLNLQGRKVASQLPQLTDNEKRDRVIFMATDIISEWMAAEPCFIDPEVAYGDKNIRFMDTVVQRLRVFKATIKPKVMKMLQDASNACRSRCPQPSAADDRTPFPPSVECTPFRCSKPKATAIVPRKSSTSGEFAFPTRQGCTTVARPKPSSFHFDTNDILPRISPSAVADMNKGVCIAAVSHPRHYEVRLATALPDPFTEGRSDEVDLDAVQRRHPSRCQPRAKYDQGVCDSPLGYPTSWTLRHPIWDTPDECKTYCSNVMMLE